jgi:hypothetical protein
MATCVRCDSEIPAARLRGQTPGRVKFCSNLCRSTYQKEQYALANERVYISPGKTGAVSELVVCADLLRREYEVFRSVSQDCSCDIIILKDGRFIRIEVRTGAINLDGSINYAQKPYDIGRSDITAVVLRGREVVYIPPLDTLQAPVIVQTVPEGAAPQIVAPQPAARETGDRRQETGDGTPAAPRPLIIIHHQSSDGHQTITGSGACAVGGSVARRCGK